MAVKTDAWIQTYTGKKFSLLDPQPEDICIEDIARALSMTCRFGGHVKKFYSVAEHSLEMVKLVPSPHGLHALLHDAGEAYIGDITSPVKSLINGISRVEDAALDAIESVFELNWQLSGKQQIHYWDMRLLLTERNQLMGPPPEPWYWEQDYKPLDIELECLAPEVAEERFLAMYKLLTGDGDSQRVLLK